ncbi:hypothetical protein [Roseisolibacter sp. H3M3-2]|uniref:hypothetical protein n=1 Tax=Roseisolibacter sp. H3M3-2 TaxID=3031323 RepID=UPI0023DB00BD|nr:hypothetical protein [Roseisolibacter sp. H3M3-2]
MELNTTVAILMGVLALAALYAAVRVNGRSEAGRRAAPGYVIFAIGAALQAMTLVRSEYSTLMAVLGTAGLVLGLGMIARAWSTRSASA